MGTWRESMWKMENGHDGRLEHGTQSEESENSSTDDKTEKMAGRVHSGELPIIV